MNTPYNNFVQCGSGFHCLMMPRKNPWKFGNQQQFMNSHYISWTNNNSWNHMIFHEPTTIHEFILYFMNQQQFMNSLYISWTNNNSWIHMIFHEPTTIHEFTWYFMNQQQFMNSLYISWTNNNSWIHIICHESCVISVIFYILSIKRAEYHINLSTKWISRFFSLKH
jgi:hypothetical protein